MNDPQLIERLATTDLYRDDVPLPDTMRSDVVLLDVTRRMDMDTQVQVSEKEETPTRNRWTGAWAAAAAFVVIIVLGLGAALLLSTNQEGEPAAPTTTIAPTVSVDAAEPTQVLNDQDSRITVTFVGNAQALAEGDAHKFDVAMTLEGTPNAPALELSYTSTDGVASGEGFSEDGDELRTTWTWVTENKLVVLMVARGHTLPDTRPTVEVIAQQTTTSEAEVFLLDAPSGTRPQGSG